MMPREPKCPACGANVDRPKCLFELGADCPRHPLLEEWKKTATYKRKQEKRRKHVQKLIAKIKKETRQ